MSLIKPSIQTVFEEPRRITFEEPENTGVYREGEVTFGNQLVGIDPGIAWGALGESFFKNAQQIYGMVLEDNITGQASALDLLGKANTEKVESLNIYGQSLLLEARETGDFTKFNQYEKDLPVKYKEIQDDLIEKSQGIIGKDYYNKITTTDADISKESPLWRKVSMQARLSSLELDNTISNKSYQLINNAYEMRKQVAASAKLNNNSLMVDPMSGVVFNKEMSEKEMNAVPNKPYLSGSFSVKGLLGDDVASVDDKGNQLLTPEGKINQDFNMDYASNTVIRTIAQLDLKYSISPNGKILTPNTTKLFKRVLDNEASRSEVVYATQLLQNMPPETAQVFASTTGLNAAEVAKLSQWAFSAQYSLPEAGIQKVLENTRSPYNEQNVKVVDSIGKTQLSYRSEEYNQFEDTNISLELPALNKPEYIVAINTMSEVLKNRNLLNNLTTFDINSDFQDSNVEDGTLQSFVNYNPAFKPLMVVVLNAMTSSDVINRPTNEDSFTKEDKNKAITALVTQTLEAHLERSGVINIDGVIHVSPSMNNLSRLSSPIISQINKFAQGTVEERDSLKTKLTKDPTKMLGIATLRGNFQSGIVEGDSENTVFEKYKTLANNFNGSTLLPADLEIFRAYIDSHGSVSTDKQGVKVSTPIPDASILRFVVAMNPQIQEHYFPAARRVFKETPRIKLERAIAIYNDIPEATGWIWDYDTTDYDMISSNNGGVPLVLIEIPSNTKGNLMNIPTASGIQGGFVSTSNRSIKNGYKAINKEGQAALVVGRNTIARSSGTSVDGLNDSIQVFIEAQIKDTLRNYHSSTTVLKNDSFPKRDKNINIDNLIDQVPSKSFELYNNWKPIENDTAISNLPGFIRALQLNSTAINETVRYALPLRNIIENLGPVEKTPSDKKQKEGALFSRDNLSIIFKHGEKNGYTNLSQYLALMDSISTVASNNKAFEENYDLSSYKESVNEISFGTTVRKVEDNEQQALEEWRASPKKFMDVKKFRDAVAKNGDLITTSEAQPKKPDMLYTGPKAGLILWKQGSPEFTRVINELLTDNDLLVYKEKTSDKYYAFPRDSKAVDLNKFTVVDPSQTIEYFSTQDKPFYRENTSSSLITNPLSKRKQLADVVIELERNSTRGDEGVSGFESFNQKIGFNNVGVKNSLDINGKRTDEEFLSTKVIETLKMVEKSGIKNGASNIGKTPEQIASDKTWSLLTDDLKSVASVWTTLWDVVYASGTEESLGEFLNRTGLSFWKNDKPTKEELKNRDRTPLNTVLNTTKEEASKAFLKTLFGEDVLSGLMSGEWEKEGSALPTLVLQKTEEANIPRKIKTTVIKALDVLKTMAVKYNKDKQEKFLDFYMRPPNKTEENWFLSNDKAAVIASADGSLVKNPRYKTTSQEVKIQAKAEAIRLYMLSKTNQDPSGKTYDDDGQDMSAIPRLDIPKNDFSFEITPKQRQLYGGFELDLTKDNKKYASNEYNNDRFLRHTIIGKILAGDPQANSSATPEQVSVAMDIQERLSQGNPNFFAGFKWSSSKVNYVEENNGIRGYNFTDINLIENIFNPVFDKQVGGITELNSGDAAGGFYYNKLRKWADKNKNSPYKFSYLGVQSLSDVYTRVYGREETATMFGLAMERQEKFPLSKLLPAGFTLSNIPYILPDYTAASRYIDVFETDRPQEGFGTQNPDAFIAGVIRQAPVANPNSFDSTVLNPEDRITKADLILNNTKYGYDINRNDNMLDTEKLDSLYAHELTHTVQGFNGESEKTFDFTKNSANFKEEEKYRKLFGNAIVSALVSNDSYISFVGTKATDEQIKNDMSYIYSTLGSGAELPAYIAEIKLEYFKDQKKRNPQLKPLNANSSKKEMDSFITWLDTAGEKDFQGKLRQIDPEAKSFNPNLPLPSVFGNSNPNYGLIYKALGVLYKSDKVLFKETGLTIKQLMLELTKQIAVVDSGYLTNFKA